MLYHKSKKSYLAQSMRALISEIYTFDIKISEKWFAKKEYKNIILILFNILPVFSKSRTLISNHPKPILQAESEPKTIFGPFWSFRKKRKRKLNSLKLNFKLLIYTIHTYKKLLINYTQIHIPVYRVTFT